MTADEACKNNVLAEMSSALQLTKEHLGSSRTAALGLHAVHGYDRYSSQIHKGRTYRQLGFAPAGFFGNASIFGSFGAQQLY